MDKVKVVLAERKGLGRIHLCECNSVHVSVGPVTIALAPEAFRQVVEMAGAAMEELVQVALQEGEDKSLEAVASSSRLTH